MATIPKLTKRAVEEIPFPVDGRQELYWIGELKGLGILVSGKKKVKSFVVQRAVKGLTRRITLGTLAEFEAADKTTDDIKAQASKLILEMRQGVDPKAADKARTEAEILAKAQTVTLKQALENYLKDSKNNLEERTLNGYRSIVEKFFSQWLDKPLREIQSAEIKKAHAEIMDNVAKGESRTAYKSDIYSSKPGACTANYALRTLRAVWKYAHSDNRETIPAWPTENLKKVWVKIPRRRKFIKGDDLKAFIDAVNDYGSTNRDLRDYILLLLFTGFRKQEAASLRWSQIDFSAEIIRLSEEDTKADRALDLPMSDFVYELLANRKARGVEGDFVFPARSASGHLEEPKKVFQLIADRCGLKVNPHALRHTFITIASQSGITAYELKALVNHSLGDDDVTAGYIHALNLKQAAQAVANKIMEFCGIELTQKVKRLPGKAS